MIVGQTPEQDEYFKELVRSTENFFNFVYGFAKGTSIVNGINFNECQAIAQNYTDTVQEIDLMLDNEFLAYD